MSHKVIIANRHSKDNPTQVISIDMKGGNPWYVYLWINDRRYQIAEKIVGGEMVLNCSDKDATDKHIRQVHKLFDDVFTEHQDVYDQFLICISGILQKVKDYGKKSETES